MFYQHETGLLYNTHILGSKKKSEGSVEPVSKEKKQVNLVDGHQLGHRNNIW